MDKLHYDKMVGNLTELLQLKLLQKKKVYSFGHCNATEELIDLLLENGLIVSGILDNSSAKQGRFYRSIEIIQPEALVGEDTEDVVICIVARAYSAMVSQLKKMGFHGKIYKVVDYNSFADYSLSNETIERMDIRLERGSKKLTALMSKYSEAFLIFCPFSALGDVFLMRSYLPYFLAKRHISDFVICIVGNVCAQVVHLFGEDKVDVLSQKEMDETIQAAIYLDDNNFFIAHQDRPYLINLHRALYVKCIPLEKIYCCGVFGLPANSVPYKALNWKAYVRLDQIPKDKSVILSPYAKSVTLFPDAVWEEIVESYKDKGFLCFTNVVGDELPIKGTIAISPKIAEMKSVVEQAGIFVGIRSGLCDVIRYTNCKKKALYPDYNYCDTKWKAIDMYAIEGWENIVVKGDFQWKN